MLVSVRRALLMTECVSRPAIIPYAQKNALAVVPSLFT